MRCLPSQRLDNLRCQMHFADIPSRSRLLSGDAIQNPLSFLRLRFRIREFEMVTIAAEYPDQFDTVKAFLTKKHASMKNYILASEDKDALYDALEDAKNWKGELPFTLIVNEKGEVVYRERGELSRSQRLVTDDRFPVHGKELVEREPGRTGDNTSHLPAAPTHAHAQTETSLAGGRELADRIQALSCAVRGRLAHQHHAVAGRVARGARRGAIGDEDRARHQEPMSPGRSRAAGSTLNGRGYRACPGAIGVTPSTGVSSTTGSPASAASRAMIAWSCARRLATVM